MGIGSESAGASKGSAPYQSPVVLVNAQADARLSGPLSSAVVSVTTTQPGDPKAGDQHRPPTSDKFTNPPGWVYNWHTESESITLPININSLEGE